MPRLFTGLEIPPEVAAELAALRGGLIGARWVDPDLYHLTLRFFGDVDRAAAGDLYDELARNPRPAFKVYLDAFAVFGGERPRALVVIARSRQDLFALQSDHERAARRVGLPPETRKFTPHVTLARLRGVSPGAAADYLTTQGFPRALTFEAREFVLYSSRDLVGGGPYIAEAFIPLNAGEGGTADSPAKTGAKASRPA